MPRSASARTSSALGWELLLFALPVMGLVAFGFVALRWDERAQREEVRARCAGLVEPLRQDLRERLARIALFPGLEETALNQPPVPGEPSDSQEQFQDGNYAAVLGNARAPSESGLPLRPLAALRLLRRRAARNVFMNWPRSSCPSRASSRHGCWRRLRRAMTSSV